MADPRIYLSTQPGPDRTFTIEHAPPKERIGDGYVNLYRPRAHRETGLYATELGERLKALVCASCGLSAIGGTCRDCGEPISPEHRLYREAPGGLEASLAGKTFVLRDGDTLRYAPDEAHLVGVVLGHLCASGWNAQLLEDVEVEVLWQAVKPLQQPDEGPTAALLRLIRERQEGLTLVPVSVDQNRCLEALYLLEGSPAAGWVSPGGITMLPPSVRKRHPNPGVLIWAPVDGGWRVIPAHELDEEGA